MCGATGLIMVTGSILLLYRGVIKLSEKSVDSALEAKFRDQIRVNIRNPALGLFAIGFLFFALALYFGKAQERSVVLRGHITTSGAPDAAVEGIIVKLRSIEWPIPVPSNGQIEVTVEPLEKLVVEICAPGYTPDHWKYSMLAHDARNGHLTMDTPKFTPATGLSLPMPGGQPPPACPKDPGGTG
jgi:hypothetical protein